MLVANKWNKKFLKIPQLRFLARKLQTLGINLTKYTLNLHKENYKMLKKESKVSRNYVKIIHKI